jgi:hypothetical protein
LYGLPTTAFGRKLGFNVNAGLIVSDTVFEDTSGQFPRTGVR